MKAIRLPLIILIVLLFVAIFLYGSILDSYTGEGLYHTRVESKDGTQWLDTFIRFEPAEGTRQSFSMFNFMYDDPGEDAVPVSVGKTGVEYTGLYYKQIIGFLYLRPTGLHFPLFDFRPGDKLTMNWEVLSLTEIDAELDKLETPDYGRVAHRSQVVDNGDTLTVDQLVYERIDRFPERLQKYVDRLDELG